MGAQDEQASFDVIVIGSGFGGSVSALRLTEKGYTVGVIEAGKRWDTADFPRTNWDVRKSLWFPKLGMKGIQRISLLRDVMVLSGSIYERMSVEIQFTARGVEINSTMKLSD